MTEAEWLTCDEPHPLLWHISGSEAFSPRKKYLYSVAVFRRPERGLRSVYVPILDELEEFADMPVLPSAKESIAYLVEGLRSKEVGKHPALERLRQLNGVAHRVFAHRLRELLPPEGRGYAEGEPGFEDDEAIIYALQQYTNVVSVGKEHSDAEAHLLRDVIGNPFQPIALVPRWQSETVVALATGIYAERAFDRMPILADALEEAGCDNADILTHCRGDSPHVRGCWVVDLLLGKS